MEIEFDPAKDAANIANHGISLAAAEGLLSGFTIEFKDTRFDYREVRIISVREINHRGFVCVYTMRGGVCRPISLRVANRKERRVYEEAKGA